MRITKSQWVTVPVGGNLEMRLMRSARACVSAFTQWFVVIDLIVGDIFFYFKEPSVLNLLVLILVPLPLFLTLLFLPPLLCPPPCVCSLRWISSAEPWPPNLRNHSRPRTRQVLRDDSVSKCLCTRREGSLGTY